MTHDFRKGVNGLLLDPACGADVRHVAELAVQMAESMSFIKGFVFNGVIVRMSSNTTPDTLVEQYNRGLSKSSVPA